MIKSKRRVLKYLVNTRVINDFGALENMMKARMSIILKVL